MIFLCFIIYFVLLWYLVNVYNGSVHNIYFLDNTTKAGNTFICRSIIRVDNL